MNAKNETWPETGQVSDIANAMGMVVLTYYFDIFFSSLQFPTYWIDETITSEAGRYHSVRKNLELSFEAQAKFF